MSPANRLKAKTYILVILVVTFNSTGNTILDKGMKQVGAVDFSSRHALWAEILRIITNGTIWGGIVCLLLFFACYMVVLSWADYSFVSPFLAISFAIVALMGHIFLGEPVPPMRWIGIALIVLGVTLVGGTSPQTAEPLEPRPAGPI